MMAYVVQHNYLRRNYRSQYMPGSMLDRENVEDASVVQGEWRNEEPEGRFEILRNVRQVTPATEASANRNNYVEYFSGPGKVPFQDRMVGNKTLH